MPRTRLFPYLTIVLLAFVALTIGLGWEAEAPSGTFQVEVTLKPVEGGHDGQVLVQDAAGKILAAPRVRVARGQAAEAVSELPGSEARVIFDLEVSETSPEATYDVKVIAGQQLLARHRATVRLE